MSELKEYFVPLFTLIIGWYGKSLTGKKDNREGEQELIEKLFKNIERIDKENKDVRERLDKLEEENRELRTKKYELERINTELIIENIELRETVEEKDVKNNELLLELIELKGSEK